MYGKVEVLATVPTPRRHNFSTQYKGVHGALKIIMNGLVVGVSKAALTVFGQAQIAGDQRQSCRLCQ